MNTKNKLLYLKSCYWLGAVLDLISAILYIFPKIFIENLGLDYSLVNAVTVYVSGHASSLMFGWTFLLVWAVRKPVERRGVLLLTVFPVVVGLFISAIYLANADLTPANKLIPILIIPVVISGVFLSAFFIARTMRYESNG